MTSSDQALLADLKLGRPEAVKVWHKRYYPKLLRFITTKVSNTKDAEELTQETFVNCLSHLPLFRGSSSIWTWMCGVAKHEVADYYRKKYAKRAIKTFPLGEMLLADGIEDAHEVADAVTKVMKKMPERSRELLKQKYLDKKRVKDIAQQWGKSVKSIESDLYRAREEFKQLYGLELVGG